MSICNNCGKEGPHFVPPCFGDPGFYSCKPKEVCQSCNGEKVIEASTSGLAMGGPPNIPYMDKKDYIKSRLLANSC